MPCIIEIWGLNLSGVVFLEESMGRRKKVHPKKARRLICTYKKKKKGQLRTIVWV